MCLLGLTGNAQRFFWFDHVHTLPLYPIVNDSVFIVDSVPTPSSGFMIDKSQIIINDTDITIIMCYYEPYGGFSINSFVRDTIPIGKLQAGNYQCHLYSREYYRGAISDPDIPCDSLPYRDSATYTFNVSVYTGLQDIKARELSFYPNPTSDKLNLCINISDADVSITDITGRSYEVPHTGREIDLSSLAAGVYVLRVQSREGRVVRRFVRE